MKSKTIFYFPFAGGNKYSYLDFANVFPEDVEVVFLELPGRGGRNKEMLLTDIHSMVEDLYQQCRERLQGDFIFYGHSMGSTLAFLTARKIRDEGLNLPQYLFLSGCKAPSCLTREPSYLNLSKEKFTEKLKDFDDRYRDVFEHKELADVFIPIIRADFVAYKDFSYVESEPLNIPMLVMIGDNEEISEDEAQLWEKETNSTFELKIFAGKHFFIFDYKEEIVDLILTDWGRALTPVKSDI